MYLFVNTDIFVLTDFSMGTAGFLLHCSLVIPPRPVETPWLSGEHT